MSDVMQTYITGPWITDLVISHHRYIISRRNWGLTSDRGLWLILNHFDCERDYLSRAETMQIFMMRYILQILSHWEMPGKEFGRLIEISTGWINQNITWASWGCGSHQSWHLAILDVRWYRNTMMMISHPFLSCSTQLSPCTFYPPSDTLNVEYGSVKATCISRIETDPAFKLQTDTK